MSELITFNKKHIITSLVIKTLSLLGSVYGLFFMITDALSFSYFTTLSNIFIDIMLAVFIVLDLIVLTTGKDMKCYGFYMTKYLATISITLTFFVYLLILAPTNEQGIIYAYFNTYAGSFFVHFFGPVLAIVDFLLFDYGYKSKRFDNILAIIPPLAYVGFVLILSHNGVRWNTMSAPYNFLNYGAPTGWFGFDLSQLSSTSLGIGVAYMIIILLIIFILLGKLFLFVCNKRRASFYRSKSSLDHTSSQSAY